MPPLRKMPPLAAAATECRFRVGRATVRRDPATTAHPCSVRLHGELVLTYVVRAVAGRPRVVREDPPRRFDQVFYLYDPDTFFQSYQGCSAIIHQMLAQTPVVGEFDLADDKWDHRFLPHDLAMIIVGGIPCADRPRCNIDVSLPVQVTAVYSEPRALLRACQQAATARRRLVAAARLLLQNTGAAGGSAECCCVCLEDFATAPKEISSEDDTVTLPCSHVFHTSCLLPWFHRVSTCPKCRRDMARLLVAITRTPKGRFPGLEARLTP